MDVGECAPAGGEGHDDPIAACQSEVEVSSTNYNPSDRAYEALRTPGSSADTCCTSDSCGGTCCSNPQHQSVIIGSYLMNSCSSISGGGGGGGGGTGAGGKANTECANNSLKSLKNKPCRSTQKTRNVKSIVNHLTKGCVDDSNFDGDDEEEVERVFCNINLQDLSCLKREKVRMDKHDIEFYLKHKDRMYHPTVKADQFLEIIKKKPDNTA